MQVERLDRHGLLLANARLVLFLAALGIAGFAWAGRLPSSSWWAALACALAFIGVAIAHDRVVARERRARVRVQINERGLAHLGEGWTELPSRGDRFADPAHPYSADLDLFGPSSLFQRIDTTATRTGEDRLASWLLAPAPIATVIERQAAVSELGPRLDFRESFETEGRMLGTARADPSRLLAWAEGETHFRLGRHGRWLALVLPSLTLALYLAGRAALVPQALWYAPFLLQVLTVVATWRRIATLHGAVAAPGERLLRFEAVFRVVEGERFAAPLLVRLADRLRSSGDPPSIEMRRLARAASFLELRAQPLFHIPLNLFTLWDLHWAGALERWQARCGPRVGGWFDTLAELEALSSLAGFAYENPDFVAPEVTAPESRLVAEGLGHPLIPSARRVTNDVALGGPGSALLVTGSNMSGKTTLLRTMGVNAVLALAGAPVCARRMVLSRLDVRTSMRVRDSLAQGLSYFYAEVRRLKLVLDACDAGPVLFLLDEVLQGTNTAERHLASRAIVKRLVERGAIGAIATHDLGLTTLEEETGGRVRNVHFTDQIVEGEMTFDYRLRPGVVATTNAIAVLRRVGIDIDIQSDAVAGGRS